MKKRESRNSRDEGRSAKGVSDLSCVPFRFECGKDQLSVSRQDSVAEDGKSLRRGRRRVFDSSCDRAGADGNDEDRRSSEKT